MVRKISKRKHVHQVKGKEPNYMIQLADPKIIRKDILESLRDGIMFMQGFERFTQTQLRKENLFNQLKDLTKEINFLVDNKLKVFLPQGKLKEIKPSLPEEEKEKQVTTVLNKSAKITPADFDSLSAELKKIEQELKTI